MKYQAFLRKELQGMIFIVEENFKRLIGMYEITQLVVMAQSMTIDIS